MNGAAAKNLFSLWRDVPRVVNHHGDDRDTGLDGNVKPALFKRPQLPRRRARPLGRNDQAFPLVAHCIDQWFHSLNRCAAVAAINEHHTRRAHQRANHRQLFQLAFAHTDDIPPDQTGHDQHVSIALMIEHENRRAVSPQMLAPANIEVQTDQCTGGLRK